MGELLECRVVGLRVLAQDLVELRLKPPHRIEASPGQFAMLRPASAGSDPLLGRPMSILEAGDQARFLIRRCGKGTRLLTSLSAGDRVFFLGPLGRGWGEPLAEVGLVLVAGGVGLAPALFAARHLAARGNRPRLLYGARTRTEHVLVDEASSVAECSLATDDGSQGYHGLVTDLLEEVVARGEGDLEVWTCGPEPMMAKVAEITRAAAIPCKVSVEARMACGRGLCLGCARPDVLGVPRYVCREGPVFPAEELFTPVVAEAVASRPEEARRG